MSNKKKKNVDRISLLPGCLLHGIMSSLNTQQVVQTCVLSKRWKTVWTCIPTLNFDFNSYQFRSSISDDGLKERSFRHSILRVLSQHRDSNIKKLSYFSWPSYRYKEDVRSLLELLICYAGCRKVEELYINKGWFDWSFCLSACHSLTVLKLSYASSSNWGDMRVPSLRILEIKMFDVVEEYDNQNMFSGCPNLVSLVLVNFICESAPKSICALKLESFELGAKENALGLTLPEFELFAPNLRYVKFENVLPNVKSAFDFSLVDEVNITLYEREYSFHSDRQEITGNLVQFLRLFQNARSITMSLAAIQLLLSVPTSVSECFSLHKLRHLKLTSMTRRKMKLKMPISKKLQHLLKCPSIEIMVVDLNQ